MKVNKIGKQRTIERTYDQKKESKNEDRKKNECRIKPKKENQVTKESKIVWQKERKKNIDRNMNEHMTKRMKDK